MDIMDIRVITVIKDITDIIVIMDITNYAECVFSEAGLKYPSKAELLQLKLTPIVYLLEEFNK